MISRKVRCGNHLGYLYHHLREGSFVYLYPLFRWNKTDISLSVTGRHPQKWSISKMIFVQKQADFYWPGLFWPGMFIPGLLWPGFLSCCEIDGFLSSMPVRSSHPVNAEHETIAANAKAIAAPFKHFLFIWTSPSCLSAPHGIAEQTYSNRCDFCLNTL